MATFPDAIRPVTIQDLIPSCKRHKEDRGLVVVQVGGLGPQGRYAFRIPEPLERSELEFHFVSGVNTRRIVHANSGKESLTQAARHVLALALSHRKSAWSFAFVAHDIGGSVVKAALLIASQEQQYRSVFENTHLLILSGVPNRPSVQHGWLSPLLSIVDSCFSGLRGPWTPQVLDRLAGEHNELAKRFAALAPKFRIISLYEAEDLVVTKRAEERIAISDQKQLEYLRPLAFEYMTRITNDCLLSHGQDLKDFVGLLSLDKSFQSLDRCPQASHLNTAQHLLSLAESQTWLTLGQSNEKILRLHIGEAINPERLFDSLAAALKHSKEHYRPSILTLEEQGVRSLTTNIAILVSSIKQLLRQQPHLYVTVEPLFSLIHDAVLSRSVEWKQRIYWRCLETLLFSPKDEDTLLFVHLTPNAAHLEVFRRILSATAKTAIPLRIAVTVASLDSYPQDLEALHCTDVDLLSATFNDAQRRDITSEIDAATSHLHLPSTVKSALATTFSATESFPDYEIALETLRHSYHRPTLLSSIHDFRDPYGNPEPVSLLDRALQDEGSWIAVAVLWVMHAMRPLSVEELNLIIAFELSWRPRKENGSESKFFLERDRASLLPQLLPGFFQIVGGRIGANRSQLFDEMAHMLCQPFLALFPDSEAFLNAHLAETCLMYVMNYVKKGPLFQSSVKFEDADQDSRLGINWRDGSKMEAAISMAQYAAEHWTTHWKLDGHGPRLDDSPTFKDFLDPKDNFVKSWTYLLVSSSDILAESHFEETAQVWQILSHATLSSFRVLEYCSYAYIRPSPTAIFDRLLVFAAELGDEEFIRGLCEVAKKEAYAFDAAEVAKAVATVPESLGLFLSQLPLKDGTPLNMPDVYLRAIQIHNISVGDTIPTALRSQGNISDTRLSELVAEALCIACEYSDSDSVSKILGNVFPYGAIINPFKRQTALHIAVSKGNIPITLQLLDLGIDIGVCTPTGCTPLILAAQHGFTELANFLVSEKGADVNARDALGRSALHFASQNGFRDIVRFLVEDGEAEVMMYDHAGETPMLMAVRNKHTEIAKFLIEAHLAHPEAGGCEPSEPVEWVTSGEEEDTEDVEPIDDSEVEMEAEESEPESVHFGAPIETTTERVAVMAEAAKYGFVDIVQLLVGEVSEEGIWSESIHGVTPLHYAAKNGSAELVKALCAYPALTNAVDREDSFTPLHLACYYGYNDVVKELLKCDPDLSFQDSSSRSPFIAACYVGALDIIQTLLPSLKDENEGIKDLGLVEAARYGQIDVVDYLLDSGCSPDATDKYKNAALHWAACQEDCRLMELLLSRRCTLDVKDDSGITPLFDATRRNAYDCVKMLLNAGADPNWETDSGRSALDWAIYWEKPSFVRLLLSKGAALKMCWHRGDTYESVLSFALRWSSKEMVRVLFEFYAAGKGEEAMTPAKALEVVLDKKPDLIAALFETWPETKDCLKAAGDEAIKYVHSTALQGKVETLKLVFDFMEKSPVNSLSGTYGTLLQAAICGNEDIDKKVKVLLDRGADPSIVVRDSKHGTALNAAAYLHMKPIIHMLLESLPPTTNRRRFMNVAGSNGAPIQAAIKGAHNAADGEALVELLDFLKGEYAPVTYSGIYKETLLHEAARKGSEGAIKWLLRNHVDADEPDTAGRRALHLAIRDGNLDVVKMLLTENTTLETVDTQKRNGLHYAPISGAWRTTMKLVDLYRGDDENRDITDLLEAQDVDAWTPLHWACRQPDLDIVQYLIDRGADTTAKTKENWTPWHIAISHGITNEVYLKLLSKPPPHERNDLPTGGATSHSACCDICFCTIFGNRFQCKSEDCTDFDMCFKCYANHSNGLIIHPKDHRFESIEA